MTTAYNVTVTRDDNLWVATAVKVARSGEAFQTRTSMIIISELPAAAKPFVRMSRFAPVRRRGH